MHKRFRETVVCLLGCASILAVSVPLNAKIDLVTLPAKDKTQLSIYKSQDLTLVRETRALVFNEGSNQIQFTWANTQIDPTSLEIRMVNESPDYTVLDASYPANTQNTIVWNIEALNDGEADVEIMYFASGLTWKAEYTVVANQDETSLRLEPNFTITNNSGEDFENAHTRLVVGEVNLEETILELSRRGLLSQDKAEQTRKTLGRQILASELNAFDGYTESMAPAGAAFSPSMREQAAEIIKQAVSEYYLYTVEGEEDLENGWGKQLPNPAIYNVEFDLSYEFNPLKYGYGVVKLYKLKNDKEHKMGDVPMPEGSYYVYSEDRAGDLRLEGITNHKYVPIGEDFELNLGSDGEVILEERTMKVERDNFEFDSARSNITGYDVTSTLEIEIRNSKDRSVPFKLTRPMTGDWEIKSSSVPFKKVDRTTAEWELTIPAADKTIITIDLVERTGSRSQSN
ncbi:MAG: DUF4139 domain-containing protein [Sumerlaeia bacterium]